jgi:hypothetical protein
MFLNKLNTTFPLIELIPVPEYSIVPAMTSNTAPAPFIASASSTYSSTYQPYRAFDKIQSPLGNNLGDCWGSFATYVDGIGDEWLQIKLDKRKILTRYVLRTRGHGIETNNGMPKVWSINGSNNGVDWTVIQNYIDIYNPVIGYIPHEYDITNTKPYLYYRIHVTEINILGIRNWGVGEWELYSIYQ